MAEARRTLEIVYGNIRDRTDLRDEVFEPSQDGRWRLVIDYPYDAATYSAADDRARVTELRDVRTRRCSAWLPAFLTGAVLTKVATLVRIDYLLGGTRLDEAATHLGPDDRQRAHDLRRNQGDALRTELRMVLEGGLRARAAGRGARPRLVRPPRVARSRTASPAGRRALVLRCPGTPRRSVFRRDLSEPPGYLSTPSARAPW